MAATVKTLLDNPGELYWGTHADEPEYHYGIAVNLDKDLLAIQLVYVLTDLDESASDEEGEGTHLITPELLINCFTVADLESTHILLSDNMDSSPANTLGWYCIELSVFDKKELESLKDSSAQHGDYLDTILQILQATPEELESEDSFLNEYSYFEFQEELCGISDLLDRGELRKPLPFQFHLIGDALLGWQTTDEGTYR